jgi:hypothetical protein
MANTARSEGGRRARHLEQALFLNAITRLDYLEYLEAGATVGPWSIHALPMRSDVIWADIAGGYVVATPNHSADAAIIAEGRNALPALIAVARAAVKMVEAEQEFVRAYSAVDGRAADYAADTLEAAVAALDTHLGVGGLHRLAVLETDATGGPWSIHTLPMRGAVIWSEIAGGYVVATPNHSADAAIIVEGRNALHGLIAVAMAATDMLATEAAFLDAYSSADGKAADAAMTDLFGAVAALIDGFGG